MMKRRTILQSLALLCGATASTPAWVRPVSQAEAISGLLAQAYPDLNGQSQALSRWKGKPILVNFWATWCAPCVKEMPELDGLYTRHPNVQFLGLAVDTSVNVVKFMLKIPISYPVLITGPSGIGLMRRLGNGPGGLPFTVVLDADGEIRKQILGPVNVASLDKLLTEVPV
jgi:thiol-disulfide isomerase/thioredoxin